VLLAALATAALASVAMGRPPENLSKKPHMDLLVGFQFSPPKDWKGVPPSSKYLGEGDITSGGTGTKYVKVCEYRNPKIGEDVHIRIYYIGGTRGKLANAASSFKSCLADAYRPDAWGETRKHRLGKLGTLTFSSSYQKYARMLTLRATVVAMDKRALGIVESWKGDTDRSVTEMMHGSVRTILLLSKSRLSGFRSRYGKGVHLSDWKTVKNRYYNIDYNTDDAFAEKLSRHMLAVQKLYRKWFPTNKRDKFRIKVFCNARGFHKYSGTPPGVVAYFSPGQGELCCYQRRNMTQIKVDGGEVIRVDKEKALEDIFRVMSHEGWHQYLQMYVGRHRFVGAPMWFNEGMAEYFFGGAFEKGGRFEIGLHSWRVGYILKAIKAGKNIPLATFLGYDRTAYYSNPGICYAQGWSLCYFLLRSGNKRYEKIPRQMLYWLKRAGDGRRAMEKVLKNIDISRLEREWLDFQKKMDVPEELLNRKK
jgi:hypothetical protein